MFPYHHVADKDALLDTMAARARSLRAAIRAHPWAPGTIQSQCTQGLPCFVTATPFWPT